MDDTPEAQFIFADLALARRLERAEARGSADFIETRAKLSPQSGAEWCEIAGAYVMFDGVRSPLTQTFGLGIHEPITADALDRIEEFYRERDAPVFHEVSPLADSSFLPLLNARGYQPVEFTTVMFRSLIGSTRLAATPNERIRVRVVGADEYDLWAQTATEGWSEFTEYADLMFDLSQVSARCARFSPFLAELDGQPIATGGLIIHDGVALLAGASTIPTGRKQGAQLALLDCRLRHAAEHSCNIAMMCASPGSASQRNAERQGFRIAYTRTKWRLARD